MRKDLIIGAVANYTKDKIVEYVQSINRCGFTGDKIMVCYDLPNETLEYLNQNGWICLKRAILNYLAVSKPCLNLN